MDDHTADAWMMASTSRKLLTSYSGPINRIRRDINGQGWLAAEKDFYPYEGLGWEVDWDEIFAWVDEPGGSGSLEFVRLYSQLSGATHDIMGPDAQYQPGVALPSGGGIHSMEFLGGQQVFAVPVGSNAVGTIPVSTLGSGGVNSWRTQMILRTRNANIGNGKIMAHGSGDVDGSSQLWFDYAGEYYYLNPGTNAGNRLRRATVPSAPADPLDNIRDHEQTISFGSWDDGSPKLRMGFEDFDTDEKAQIGGSSSSANENLRFGSDGAGNNFYGTLSEIMWWTDCADEAEFNSRLEAATI